MIASVRGQVAALRLDAVVVEVGGVGMQVQATPSTLARLRLGEEAHLATSLVVREDSLTLFGFADPDERDVFELLLGVAGIGPRLALAMLAVHTPDGLRAAVSAEDVKALTRVPGIGPKSAARLVLELGDRLGPPQGPDAQASSTLGASAGSAWRDQVVAALTGLGWATKQAEDAVDVVTARTPAGREADVPALLRASLRYLGGT